MAYHIYKVHLLDGNIIEFAEDYYLPPRKGIVEIYRNAEENAVITFGDAINGYCYVPKNNILYITTCGVKVVD